MPWALAGGAALGVANYLVNKSANDRAQMINNEMFQKWMQVNIPDPEQQKIALQRFVSTGDLSPEMQHAIAQAPSEFSKVVTNSEYQGAQNRALGELSKIGNEGGLRLQDKVALQDARMDAITREKSGRQGIADQMARRGLSGSGYDVSAQLSGQQGVADRESNASLRVASDAQDRALQALMGAGKMATDYRSQDFGEQSAKAQAADRINAFNTANLRDVNAANVSAMNSAQEYNVRNKQRISDQNTQTANAEEKYNKELYQQQYENRLKQLGGAAGQSQQLAAGEQRAGQLLGNTLSNVGTAGINYALMDQYFGGGNKNQGGGSASPNSASGSGYQQIQSHYDPEEDPFNKYRRV